MGKHGEQSVSGLLTAWEQLLDYYGQALKLAENLHGRVESAEALQSSLREIDVVLQQTPPVHAAIKRLDDAQKGKQSANRERVETTRKKVADVVARLQATIAHLEQQAVAAREHLRPQIDDLARSKQMQRAYGASRKYAGS